MAYRIRYGGKIPQVKTRNHSMLKIQGLMALALAGCLFAAGKWLPGGKAALAGAFFPKAGTATEAMARELNQGGSLREAVVVFCQQVLINAGYGA